MPELQGRCLCGQFSYESSAAPLATMICHCKNCQRQGGAAFSVNVVVPADAVTTKGALKSFLDKADSGNTVERQFCAECGSPIFSLLSANPGITRDGLLLRMSDEDWEEVLDTNLKGAFFCMRAVSKIMMRQRAGLGEAAGRGCAFSQESGLRQTK